MTKGQRAMAMIHPEPARGGRGKKSSETEEFSGTRLSMARTAIRYSVDGDLADDVLAETVSLDVAYQTARARKDAASSDETRLAEIRRRYPELADKVVEGELTLAGALRIL